MAERENDLPDLTQLAGIAPNWTGGLTVDQYMSWQRDRDYDGPEPNWDDPEDGCLDSDEGDSR